MALTGALAVFVHAVAGFTNKSLRGLVAGLLGQDYTTNQMIYDLRRLRVHALIDNARLSPATWNLARCSQTRPERRSSGSPH